jgi:hypothetical protein
MSGDIVLWYDDLEENNCVIENAVYLNRSILKKLTHNNIKFSVRQTSEELDNSKTNVYVIELHNVHAGVDIFSKIPQHTKNLFKAGLSVMLYYPREGHSLEEWFVNIHNNLQKNNLLDANILFVFGDYDIEVNYALFLNKYKLDSFVTPVAIDYFAGDYFENVSAYNTFDNVDADKKYDFLFYNGKLRPHRLYAVAELARLRILKRNLVSLTATTHTSGLSSLDDCLRVLKQVGLKTKYITNFARSFKPIILDMPSDKFSQDSIHNTELWHYTDTFFSIISETTIDNRFITEKIYKPMLNLHPFIIIGAPRILELLKEKGYYTFEEMFDESYDTELDPVVRINKVISNVNNFSKKTYKEKHKIYKSIIPKLLHNRNHYFSTATTSSVNEFSKIFKTLEEST